MRLLLDTMTVVAASNDAAELARNFTERLFETLHARRVGVLETSRQRLVRAARRPRAHGRGRRVPSRVLPRDLAILERACRERVFVAENSGPNDDLSLCALPLCLQDRCLGGIVLEVTSVNVSFEGSDRQFLDALASEMAVALDRTRLLERERERQREEKERLEAEVTDLRLVLHGSRLAYRSPSMESLLATARKIARTDTTVLITGESGTGKEMLAHTVHELSGRRDKPVVVVDCGAIAPTLIESELFGHEKGAFTGAHTRKPGRLSQAEGATVFLDEIGELPLDLQTKLLRFVQEKQFTPVGSVVAAHRGRAHHRRHQRGPPRPGGGGQVPRGPVPPPQRRPAARRPPPGTQGRHPPPGDDLPAAVRRPLPAAGASLHRAGGAGARGLSLAGQRARAAEPDHDVRPLLRRGGSGRGRPPRLPGRGAAGGADAAPAVQRARRGGSARRPARCCPAPPPAIRCVKLRQALSREIASAVGGRTRQPRPARQVAGRGPDPRRRPPGLGRVTPGRRAARAAPTARIGGSSRPLPRAAPRGSPCVPPPGRMSPGSSKTSSRPDGTTPTSCQWAEAGLLAEIESAVPGDPRTAAALLGRHRADVAPPTRRTFAPFLKFSAPKYWRHFRKRRKRENWTRCHASLRSFRINDLGAFTAS